MNKITKKQKIVFFQFCLDVYTKSVEEVSALYDISSKERYAFYKIRGFCLLFQEFFDVFFLNDIIEYVPELLKYKPKNQFFTWENEVVNDPSQFWFPCGENEPRIKIIKEILAELQQSEEKIV